MDDLEKLYEMLVKAMDKEEIVLRNVKTHEHGRDPLLIVKCQGIDCEGNTVKYIQINHD